MSFSRDQRFESRKKRAARPTLFRVGKPLGRLSHLLLGLAFSVLQFQAGVVSAAVSDLTASDVTTRAFSVVWASNLPIINADVRVFSDAAGTSEITANHQITLESAGLTLGLVRIDVHGAQPGTCSYVQTETTGDGESVLAPAAPPFLEVCTPAETTKANAQGEVITNDIIGHDVLTPGTNQPATGALMLVSVPSISNYPLSGFAGSSADSPARATVDLNNLFDQESQKSAETLGDEIVTLTELRGSLCPGLENHRLVRYRRLPVHEEVGSVGRQLIEVEQPASCFFADTACDERIDIVDVQRVLNVFGADSEECRFNSDLDIVADQRINILDIQSVLNRFGQEAPFSN